MKQYIIFLLSTLMVLICSNSVFGASKNLINNPKLEKSIKPWNAPSYWSGQASYVCDKKSTKSGKGCMKLVVANKKDKYWGRIYQATRAKQLIGRRFSYSMWVKGEGEFLLGVIKYTRKKDKGSNCIYYWQKVNTKLTKKWQKVTFEFIIEDPKVFMISAVAELRGKGSEAFIDDVSFVNLKNEKVTIKAQQRHSVVSEGMPLPNLLFKLFKSGKALPKAVVNLYLIFPDGSNKIITSITDSQGIYSYSPGNIKFNSTGICKIVCSAPKFGVVSEIFIDVIAKKLYAKLDTVAKQIKLGKSLHILYLGDSLTDFNRGHNYTDKIDYWLNKYNRGKASFRNAGIGGDFIVRMWKRIQGIEGKRKAYRQDMYNGLLDKKFDIIFISLGHNDTKADNKSGYNKVVVEPKLQKKTYQQLIDYIRRKSDAKIILLSATSSFSPRCKANAKKLARMGRKHVMFGQPQKLEAFNDVLKTLSEELKIDYVDIYTPTKNHPDKASLFNPNDGVHLTEKGNCFIAMLLLDYISKNKHKTAALY